MPAEVSPFIAASPGAAAHLVQNPLIQAAMRQGIFKDIWGSTYSDFMGMDSSAGYGGSGEIPDNTQGRTQAFAADVSVYRCVDLRGAAVASVPLKIYDSADPTKRVEVEHEAMGVLMQTNPSAWVAGPQLMRYSIGSRDLHGSFAWRIVNDSGGRLRNPLPRELYWLPPGQYKPVAGQDLQPAQPKIPFAGLKLRPGDSKPEYFLPAAECVYAPTYNPMNPLIGTSRITALRTDLNLRLYGANSNLWFFRNNQRPDVVVTGAFSPTPENVGLMRRIWKAAFGGDGNRGPAFLPSDMRVNLLTMSQKDAEWLGQRQAAREDILAAFGVPPPVYGDLSRATYENIRVAYEAFWRTGMIPELDEMAWVLTQQFLWKWPDAQKAHLVFAYDYAAIEALQEDANSIWERIMAMIDRLNTAVERRNLLPNQMREIAQQLFKSAGLPDKAWKGKVPGGDMFYLRLNDIPIIEASVQANIDSLAARAGITSGQTNQPGNGKWVLPDATEVTGPPPPAGAVGQSPAPSAALPAASAPAAPPAVPAKVMIHNHLTRLEWPQVPHLPDEDSRPRLDHGAGGEPLTGVPGVLPRSETVQLGSRVLRAQDWLMRRLKRHFQAQQTACLRAMRAEPRDYLEPPWPWDLMESEGGLREMISAACEMASLSLAEDQAGLLARDIEDELVDHFISAQMSAQGNAERLRHTVDMFRRAIDVRAAEIARQVITAEERVTAA